MGRRFEFMSKRWRCTSVWARVALAGALLFPSGVASADGIAGAGEAPGAKAITMADVVKLALKNNETARIAELKIDGANGAVESAVGGFLPTVTLGGSGLADAHQDAKGHHLSGLATLRVPQPLLHPSAIPVYRPSRYTLDAAKLPTGEEDRGLAFQTAKAFTPLVPPED